MDSNKDEESETESEIVTIESYHNDVQVNRNDALVGYRRTRNKNMDTIERNRIKRRHFSVIQITEEDDSRSKKLNSGTFFNLANRKSIELKVVESEMELKSKSSINAPGAQNGIWGSHSWTLDTKTLHPGAAELLDAAFAGNIVKINLLLDEHNSLRHSHNFEVVDLFGRTALHLAVYNDHFEIAKLLINQGVTVNIWDQQKKATPLICAAAIGQVQLVELLLNNGADVNNGYERGNTALLWAAKSGNYECLKKILEAGALQNTPVMYCETPLHVAASSGDDENLKLLLNYGADASFRKGPGRNTALHLAAQECNTSCCKLLLDYGANVDTQNAKGETALHISALKDVDTVLLLLEHGADVGLQDVEGRTALFYAVEKTSRNVYAMECVAALIKYNADVNWQDNLGLCPLHIAAIKEANDCASILIENNANVSLESKSGTSALSMMLRKIPDTMNFIKKHLNDSVIVIRDTNDSSCKVKLDFKTIAPNYFPANTSNSKKRKKSFLIYRKESELIKSFLSTGQKELLLHPLVEAFLTLKWKNVRKFFYFGFLLKLILVLLFSVFMVYLYAICVEKVPENESIKTSCNNTVPVAHNNLPKETEPDVLQVKSQDQNGSMATKDNAMKQNDFTRIPNCLIKPVWITIWTLMIGIAVILIAQELTQLFQSFKAYITYIESWIFWFFITSLCVTCQFLPNDGNNFKHEDWQQAFAAVSVFLAWIFVLLQLGKFPLSGTLVQMFCKVFYNFLQFFGAFFCIIMAFALAFYILNPVDKAFHNPLYSFAQTIRMMAGDVNPDKLLFDTKFPIVAQILFSIFVVTVVIVLMNLLVGLAVADIQGMYTDARLLRLSRQAALIYHLESSFLSPFTLRWMPKSFALVIAKNTLILPNLRNGCYYFKPYDHRDDGLPEYLKLSSLKMVNTSGTNGAAMSDVLLKVNEIEKQLAIIVKKLDSLSSDNASTKDALSLDKESDAFRRREKIRPSRKL